MSAAGPVITKITEPSPLTINHNSEHHKTKKTTDNAIRAKDEQERQQQQSKFHVKPKQIECNSQNGT
jgi:hypothetical protein